jgi:acetyl esterase/lipase
MGEKIVKYLTALAAFILSATPIFAQPMPDMMKAIPTPASPLRSIPLLANQPDHEQWEQFFGQTMVRNVTRPAIYPILPPPERANGKAVIVVPGGGYQFVSMESEGFRVAERLAAEGYTAFVLKYRTVPNDPDSGKFMAEMAKLFGGLGTGDLPDHKPAVDDLAAAIKLVSADATKWNIKPDQIGAVGFSAGSRSLVRLIEQSPEAAYLVHIGLIYPPMTQSISGGPRPPLFMAIAVNDPLFKQGGLTMIDSWLKQSDKTEFHLYSGGNHGFGMRPQGTTSDYWIDEYISWLNTQP